MGKRGERIQAEVYPDVPSEKDGPAATYHDRMRHNATSVTQALGSQDG